MRNLAKENSLRMVIKSSLALALMMLITLAVSYVAKYFGRGFLVDSRWYLAVATVLFIAMAVGTFIRLYEEIDSSV